MSLDFLNRLKMARVDDGDGWDHHRPLIMDVKLFEKMGSLKRLIIPMEIKFRVKPKGRKYSVPWNKRSDKSQPQVLAD